MAVSTEWYSSPRRTVRHPTIRSSLLSAPHRSAGTAAETVSSNTIVAGPTSETPCATVWLPSVKRCTEESVDISGFGLRDRTGTVGERFGASGPFMPRSLLYRQATNVTVG